eukprot:TRINITY_DN73053_c0_g1_i1.p1 TRINITY_DN73053_c0_g1~~TRINITY_DN73053_c0_g1_i1.p1  ORF type:complete len:466 (+),score=77.12 TRINITY_DN73053_c0_g1_i1:52-1449(+)
MDLEAELVQILTSNAISDSTYSRATTCLKEIEKCVEQLGKTWRVRAFGSLANGLCMERSDLDATCYSLDPDVDVTPRAKMDFLTRLQDILGSHGLFTIVEFVASARVPILRLRYEGVLEVDLSCSNTEPFPNTQLLHAYTELHPLVREFLLLVKCWGKAAGVVGAKDGNLSSYSMTLMGIYFLQVEPRIRMPCFSTSDFDGGMQIPESAKIQWSLNCSRSALLHMFFRFYAFEFQWSEEVVAMHLGYRSTRNDPVHSSLADVWEQRLHIADPFLTQRNLNCVLRSDNEMLLYSQFQSVASELQMGYVPASLRSPTPHGAPWPGHQVQHQQHQRMNMMPPPREPHFSMPAPQFSEPPMKHAMPPQMDPNFSPHGVSMHQRLQMRGASTMQAMQPPFPPKMMPYNQGGKGNGKNGGSTHAMGNGNHGSMRSALAAAGAPMMRPMNSPSAPDANEVPMPKLAFGMVKA